MEIEQQIWKILSGCQQTLVFTTANQLGIFDQLCGPPVSADQVAKNLNLSLKGTERLLNVLSGLNIVTKENNQFQLPEAWRSYLSQNGENSMKHWIQATVEQLKEWERLPEFIASGKPIYSFMDLLHNDPKNTRAFIERMHRKGLKSIGLIHNEIPVGEATHMLDIGGGPGTYTLEWAKLHKHLKATIFDLPSVLEVTRDYIKQYGMEDRINTKAGDFNKDDLGNGYDLVLLANILHMYDADSNRALIKKAVQSLDPGGRIVIHCFCTDDDGTSPMTDTMFSLGIAMSTEGGASHPIRQIVRWLEETGIQEVRHFRLKVNPTGVITGTKKK